MIKHILLILLFPTLLVSQAPVFLGKPLAVEELSYELDASGNQNPTARWAMIYHFDDAGRLSEHWSKTPGEKDFLNHTVHTYMGEHPLKSVQTGPKGNIQETLEHFYDETGKLVRILKTGPIAAFNQDMEVVTDSLDRIVWIKSQKPKGNEPPEITENVFTDDTLAVSTTRDATGQVKGTWTRRMNDQGDLLYFVQTNETGAVVHEAHYFDYAYDDAGNWTERKSRTRYTLFGEERKIQAHDIRRIVYPGEYPETLTPSYLQGSWAGFLYGLQLDFFADGTYLAYTWESRKDGGQWTLDTQKNILSVTGKEHRETSVPLDFRYENGAIILYKPGAEGEVRLVKLK
ncbi:MAG: hypothetical protein H6563_09615 [Lewinellaceae bacterium]|nr:hypothetical protein [Lewinellaceae bacterium]